MSPRSEDKKRASMKLGRLDSRHSVFVGEYCDARQGGPRLFTGMLEHKEIEQRKNSLTGVTMYSYARET
jgi:hypothetical protein